MVTAALFHAVLTVVSVLSPPSVVKPIAMLLPFWLVWLLVLLNVSVCLWVRLPGFFREVLGKRLAERTGARWRREIPAEHSEQEVRQELREMGYRCQAEAEGKGLWGVRRRFGVLGTLFFHGALIVATIGFVLTIGYRREIEAAVSVGEQFTGSTEQFRGGGAISVEESFAVDEIIPEFWGDQLLFTSLTAKIRTPDSDGPRELRINQPLWTSFASLIRLTNFGYAPAYQITDRMGQVVDSAIVRLGVFPPGSRDYFTPVGLPHRVHLEVYPDVADPASPVTASLNLVNPLLRVHITRGKLTIAAKDLRLGEAIDFEGLKLRFPEIRYYGEFALLSDPGALVLLFGFVLAFVGLILRAAGRRAEVQWVPGEGGRGGELLGFGTAEPPQEGKQR